MTGQVRGAWCVAHCNGAWRKAYGARLGGVSGYGGATRRAVQDAVGTADVLDETLVEVGLGRLQPVRVLRRFAPAPLPALCPDPDPHGGRVVCHDVALRDPVLVLPARACKVGWRAACSVQRRLELPGKRAGWQRRRAWRAPTPNCVCGGTAPRRAAHSPGATPATFHTCAACGVRRAACGVRRAVRRGGAWRTSRKRDESGSETPHGRVGRCGSGCCRQQWGCGLVPAPTLPFST